MDHQGGSLTRSSSTSSAVDLTGVPLSPALDPSERTPRRRTSWGRLDDAVQDPLRDPAPSAPLMAQSGSRTAIYSLNDDPFISTSPTNDSTPSLGRSYASYYVDKHPTLSSQSTSSLIAGDQDDAEAHAHLTSNISRTTTDEGMWGRVDPESEDGAERRRKRTMRYSASPLKKSGTAIKAVQNSLRRVSLRVVNFGGSGLEDHVRLHSGDEASQQKLEDDGDEPPATFSDTPLRGQTLCFLGPESGVRLWLYKFLRHPWTEPTILLLIIANAVVLTIQSARSLTLASEDDSPPRVRGYFHAWEDYALFALFIIFTVEALARISVSGFVFDPDVPATSIFTSPFASYANSVPTSGPHSASVAPVAQGPLSRGLTIRQRLQKLNENFKRPFALSARPANVRYLNEEPPPIDPRPSTSEKAQQDSTFLSRVIHSSEGHKENTISLPFRLSIVQARDKVSRNVPYLRQSWNRIDFVAIVSFWITFMLAMNGWEQGEKHIRVFRAMSVLRTARLLTITSGTTTIMHSLKTARPLLTSVAYFVLFAMVLFSIIGIQSFKGSMRRTCYLNSVLGEDEMIIEEQFCGGYINPQTLNTTAYIQLDGSPADTEPKGYICPIGQTCKEGENPVSNIESFDTIYNAALQVIIVASANGWTPLMYSTIDAEFFVSSIYFIVAVIVLNFWLINLFVAVITNTFSAIRAVTKKSAFGAAPLTAIDADQEEDWSKVDGRRGYSRGNIAKVIVTYTKWLWIFLALASLVLQATREVNISLTHERVLYFGELGITIAFDIEIVLRLLATLPNWREFFRHANNVLDLFLAVATSIIQIPVIQESSIYPWFTSLQLMRFYRVILEVPRMRPLLLAVFGNLYGLVNMTLFVLLMNYLATLVALQMLRGDMTDDVNMNFSQMFNAFLAMYQVFSSENWGDILYDSATAEVELGQAALVVIFVSAWMLFANFIVLQMFIAVINENFEVAEEAKKGKQAASYWANQQVQERRSGWMRRLNPYRWMKANPVKMKVENLPSNLVLPMQKAMVQDYDAPQAEGGSGLSRAKWGSLRGARHYPSKSLTMLQTLFAGRDASSDVPLANLKHTRQETLADDETERHLELLASVNQSTASTEEINDAIFERRAQKADFIRDHPSYDKTFWIFSQKNPMRRVCQRMVQPAHGERIFGLPPSPILHPIFQLMLLLAVIGGIVVESIATPSYRRQYYADNGFIRGAWFDIAESAFGLVLLVEFLIKIVADGFVFTPNAYVRSIWNILDLFILCGLLVNVITGLIFIGGLSRLTRSLKALRALRLITLIEIMRTTFESLIISGATRILDAAVLAILYMIPYAVWGLNIFAGKMNECNDSDVAGANDCIGEFTTTVYGESFGFLSPRVWDNPAPSTKFSFDNFRSSLLILFEIVSLEGWIDVMNIATGITGVNQQPQTNVSQANAIFFLVYNLLGGVVILTLFVSIIIGNFSSKTGSAFLTKPQREWIDLQKLFRRQRPSKRPRSRPTWPFRAWCYDRAVHKHGWWSRMMTVLFFIHIIFLMTQTFSSQNLGDTFRNEFFLGITFVYIIDVMIRFTGLGWSSFFANGWNHFDAIVSLGSFFTTLLVRFGGIGFAVQQLQKLFVVSIAFKLVQRTNSLNKLFKTAVASLPIIVSLLGLWLILFLFFSILFVEVFGLTKWDSGETRNQNYSTVGSSLVMLAFMSTGEGWNQYMHDYTIVYPRCTNSSILSPVSDCGSTGWAFTLFIAWNILSMYIFLNMFTGVVVENFSYVFQTSAGGAKSITREEMRAFKKVWAEFANPKTGYLERARFVPFFAKLSGVFEVRIYPSDHSIPNILSAARPSSEVEYTWPSRVVDGIELNKLEQVLNTIDYKSIRRRRAIYSRLYHEASISHHNGRGISFTGMLMLLAHHKLIVDHEALVLKDLVVRNETNKLVTDLVNLDRVRSLLKTISHRRRFLRYLDEKRRVSMEAHDIPSIVVDATPVTPPMSSRDISSYGMGLDSVPNTPSPRRTRRGHDASLSQERASGAGLQRSNRRTSDISMLSTDLGYHSRDFSADDDVQNVLASMQNSMWGDLMSEAMKEEKNRSSR